jgi:hypothetical protein
MPSLQTDDAEKKPEEKEDAVEHSTTTEGSSGKIRIRLMQNFAYPT